MEVVKESPGFVCHFSLAAKLSVTFPLPSLICEHVNDYRATILVVNKSTGAGAGDGCGISGTDILPLLLAIRGNCV